MCWASTRPFIGSRSFLRVTTEGYGQEGSRVVTGPIGLLLLQCSCINLALIYIFTAVNYTSSPSISSSPQYLMHPIGLAFFTTFIISFSLHFHSISSPHEFRTIAASAPHIPQTRAGGWAVVEKFTSSHFCSPENCMQ